MTRISLKYAPAPGARLPVSRVVALRHAAELKRRGLSWNAVAVVMAEYHGHHLTGGAWRNAIVGMGIDVPRRDMSPAKLRALSVLQERNRDRPRMVRQIVDGVAA